MITERQEKVLNALVKEYICGAEPVSSKLLKERGDLDVSPATIRNDFQELTEMGYIAQPHTSAGRVPTEKAYKYFVDKMFANREDIISDFILKEIAGARKQIENEMKLAEELMRSLSEMSLALNLPETPEKDTFYKILIKIGPSRTIYNKNINVINEIIKELEGF
ncbi:MAG: DeoR family transcriptional regulator [Candidatus Staskawiczbacteria bacterium]|nr:DeoR family transcriptional regulator [Candidatus Staskawiczbacteria bacterium]